MITCDLKGRYTKFQYGLLIMEEIKPHNIVIGQRVKEEKVELALQMRQAMTKAEAILWLRLRRNRMGVSFRRQQIIKGFIADFYCHQQALVIEVDGPVHDADYDAEQDLIFASAGMTVLRFQNHEVETKIGWVISCIHHFSTKRSPKLLTLPFREGQRLRWGGFLSPCGFLWRTFQSPAFLDFISVFPVQSISHIKP